MPFADDGVEFPVPEARALRHNRGPGFDADAIRKLAAPLSGAITLLALLFAAQMLVQGPARFLVGQNVLIDPFMTDRGTTGSL